MAFWDKWRKQPKEEETAQPEETIETAAEEAAPDQQAEPAEEPLENNDAAA